MRFKTNPNVTELAVTAGLLFMSALNLYGFADSFSVCNLRNAEVNLNAELCFKL